MTAMKRFIQREGRPATLIETTESGADKWKDPTSAETTECSTKALVRLVGSQDVTVNVAGETVQIDAELVIPSDFDVSPEGENRRPVMEIGGQRYKVWLVDDNGVPGARRLLATRE